MCFYLNLQGKNAKDGMRKSYNAYSKGRGLQNYILLKERPNASKCYSTVAFASAKDILGFLRQRKYPADGPWLLKFAFCCFILSSNISFLKA